MNQEGQKAKTADGCMGVPCVILSSFVCIENFSNLELKNFVLDCNT